MADIELYRFSEKLARQIAAVKASRAISTRNKTLFLDFLEWQAARGISRGRQYKNMFILRRIGTLADRDLDKAGMRDLQRLVARINGLTIERGGRLIDASPWHRADLRTILKSFIRWLKADTYNAKDYEWLHTPLRPNERKTRVEEGDVLTVEEVESMIRATNSVRDKALIAVSYESATRPSELLSLRVGNVRFDAFGAILNIQKSKTQPIRILNAAPYLRAWMNVHPFRSDVSAPLWTANRSPAGDRAPIGIAMFAKTLRAHAQRAGIRKRVYPYLLRHSRLTHLVQKYPDQIVKRISGHSATSKHFEVYLHMSNRDVDNVILRDAGLITDDEEARRDLEKPTRCWNCGAFNSIESKFCEGCNFALDYSNLAATMAELKKLSPIIAQLSRLQTMPAEHLAELKRADRVASVAREHGGRTHQPGR